MRILIAGGGDVGFLIAQRLIREGNEITIVEIDPRRCEYLEGVLDARIICGNAASVGTLKKAGSIDLDILIAITDIDEINLLCCLIAQVELKATYKIARIRTHEVDGWRQVCEKAGVKIDLIIHAESDIVDRILRVLPLPGVSEIFDFANGQIRLFGLNVEDGAWIDGKTMEQIQAAGAPKNSLVAMIFRGPQVMIPHGGDVVKVGDQIYVLTSSKQWDETLRFLGVTVRQKVDRVFIVGGRQISIRLAQELERRDKNVKLFEQDPQRCEKIARLVKRTVIVCADGTDERVLEEENVAGVDAFLALTGDDEDNIIACLLAKKLGNAKVAALLNRLNYVIMAQRLGISTTISPRLVTVDRALRFVRKGGVLSVTTFRQEEAEAIELIAPADSKYVGVKLSDLRFPEGVLVGAIARTSGEVIVPRGDAVIQPGDRVIFFALEEVVPKLEAAFLREGQGRPR
jgi:K+ transport systems, NAD-binding component